MRYDPDGGGAIDLPAPEPPPPPAPPPPEPPLPDPPPPSPAGLAAELFPAPETPGGIAVLEPPPGPPADLTPPDPTLIRLPAALGGGQVTLTAQSGEYRELASASELAAHPAGILTAWRDLILTLKGGFRTRETIRGQADDLKSAFLTKGG